MWRIRYSVKKHAIGTWLKNKKHQKISWINNFQQNIKTISLKSGNLGKVRKFKKTI